MDQKRKQTKGAPPPAAAAGAKQRPAPDRVERVSKRRHFTAGEFERAAGICRMEADSIALARAVMVDGETPASVAAAQGVTRQWISEAVRKMRNYIEQANPVPPGWKADLVTLPNRDWPTVRALERAARARLPMKPTYKRGT